VPKAKRPSESRNKFAARKMVRKTKAEDDELWSLEIGLALSKLLLFIANIC
jgi:hypothetical protein